MSAQEFVRWQVWLDAHRIGTGWDALRHAEQLAAAHNGALVKRDKTPWRAADFMPADPWAAQQPPPTVASAQDLAAQIAALGSLDA